MRSELKHTKELSYYLEELYRSGLDDQKKNDQNFFMLLEETRKNSDTLNKTKISISHDEARYLSLFIQMHRPQKFIEIGTLTGYSALWIAKNMDGGKLYTIEKDPQHAAYAKSTLAKFQSKTSIQVINGDAQEVLNQLASDGPFDGIFIDGNKAAYGDYLNWAVINLKSGALILADNVFAGGGVYDQPDGRFSPKMIDVMKKFNQRLAGPEFSSVLLPTNEGLFIALKR